MHNSLFNFLAINSLFFVHEFLKSTCPLYTFYFIVAIKEKVNILQFIVNIGYCFVKISVLYY